MDKGHPFGCPFCFMCHPAPLSWRIDWRSYVAVDSSMKFFPGIVLFSFILLVVSGLYFRGRTAEIRTYSAYELINLNCAELGERHEEIIASFHDAAIARYRKTGVFPDDLGLPRTEDLPIVVLILRFIQDNGLSGFDFSRPHSLSTSGAEADLFSELSNLCAASPSLDAMQAVEQAARRLDLVE